MACVVRARERCPPPPTRARANGEAEIREPLVDHRHDETKQHEDRVVGDAALVARDEGESSRDQQLDDDLASGGDGSIVSEASVLALVSMVTFAAAQTSSRHKVLQISPFAPRVPPSQTGPL